MILGTAGHIDHGKTTLVRALTGVDTDRIPEERRRGITIELGFAPLVLDDGTIVGIVDVPGHEAFVRTMVAGATGIDLALLIVAADEGVMPQTREHAAILRLLGVRRGVVALTKCDLVDPDWLELVREDVAAFLATTSLAGSPVIPTAAPRREGIAELRGALGSAASTLLPPGGDDLFRMPVDRAFTIKGTGTVVTGTVWSGGVSRDQVVRVLPGERLVRVRAVQAHGAAVDRASSGSRTALALVGVEPADVARGTVLVGDAAWAATQELRADVELLADAPALGSRTRVRLHLGTSEVGARLVVAGGVLTAGDERPARISLDAPLVARAGDRFVVRGGPLATTLGGGTVTDPLPPRRRPRPWPAAALPLAQRLTLLLAEAGFAGIAQGALPIRLGVPGAAVAPLLAAEEALTTAGRAYARAAVDGAVARLCATVDAQHRRAPLEAGMSVQTLRASAGIAAELAEHLLRRSLEEGVLTMRQGVVWRSGWVPALSAAQEAALLGLLSAVGAGGREPPTVAELAARFGAESPDLLRFLERRGELCAIGEDRYFLPGVVDALMACLRDGMQPDLVYAPAELRQLLGLPRRLLIPILEYADRVGVTARRGDGRQLASGGVRGTTLA